jgi:hypothetical protein
MEQTKVLQLVQYTVESNLLNASGHQHENQSDDNKSSERDP